MITQNENNNVLNIKVEELENKLNSLMENTGDKRKQSNELKPGIIELNKGLYKKFLKKSN